MSPCTRCPVQKKTTWKQIFIRRMSMATVAGMRRRYRWMLQRFAQINFTGFGNISHLFIRVMGGVHLHVFSSSETGACQMCSCIFFPSHQKSWIILHLKPSSRLWYFLCKAENIQPRSLLDFSLSIYEIWPQYSYIYKHKCHTYVEIWIDPASQQCVCINTPFYHQAWEAKQASPDSKPDIPPSLSLSPHQLAW